MTQKEEIIVLYNQAIKKIQDASDDDIPFSVILLGYPKTPKREVLEFEVLTDMDDTFKVFLMQATIACSESEAESKFSISEKN